MDLVCFFVYGMLKQWMIAYNEESKYKELPLWRAGWFLKVLTIDQYSPGS